jgi:Spy/CpxP family protein refolding chaperone
MSKNMKCALWRFFLFCIFLSCGAGGSAMPVFAHSSGSPPFRGERLKQAVAELGLEEKVLTTVNSILDASSVEQQQLRSKLNEAYERMHGLLEQPEPDEATVMSQADVIGALETEARKHRLRTILRVRALLTPEQRVKLLELIRARGGRGARAAQLSEEQSTAYPKGSPGLDRE